MNVLVDISRVSICFWGKTEEDDPDNPVPQPIADIENNLTWKEMLS